jgi:hypothetical protein
MPQANLYLRKANDELVSHCRCSPSDAWISSPAQMDCPWCGCGWLFVCGRCRKSFTFGEAFETTEPYDQIARRFMPRYGSRAPEADEITKWVEWMRILTKGIQAGQRCVYLDGWILPIDDGAVSVEGWHSTHQIKFVPQVEALARRQVIDELLSSKDYWLSTKLPDDETG